MAPSLKILATSNTEVSGVIIDPKTGNLFGTNYINNGQIYTLKNVGGVYSQTPTILAKLTYAESFLGVIEDANGNLFGENQTTVYEDVYSNGVYSTKLTALSSVAGGSLTPSTNGNFYIGLNGNQIFEVTKNNGTYAVVSTNGKTDLQISPQLNLFVSSELGSDNTPTGAIAEIPFSNGAYGNALTVTTSFVNGSGVWPIGEMILDSQGDIFGATHFTGYVPANPGDTFVGYATIYEVKDSNGVYDATPTLLATFNDPDVPNSLTMDAAGNLFGTANATYGVVNGEVFEIAKINGVYSSTPTILATISEANG